MGSLLLVVSTFLVTFFGLGAAGLAYAGPVAVLAGVAALRLSQHGQAAPWASVGLVRPDGAGRLALATLGCLLAGWAGAVAATLLATRGLDWAPIDTARFAGLHGNASMLLGLLAISWSTAAFGEEVLFRGFLQSRLQALVGASAHSGGLAVVLQALLFGLAHAYQGPTGILVTGAVGLAFGLCRLRLRSLWPLVIAHGLIDTLSMVALYFGAAAPR